MASSSSNGGGSSSSSSARTWCSDALHSLLGYSDSSLSSYLISIAKSARSPADIVSTLREGGVAAATATAAGGGEGSASEHHVGRPHGMMG